MAIGSEAWLRGVVAEAVPGGTRDKLWATGRRALRIRPEEHITPDAPGSRLGGQPLAAPGTPWPRWERGPLDLLAQIDLAEVARLLPATPLPGHGLLSFFYDTDTPAWSLLPPDPASWLVRWEPDAVEPIPVPEDWTTFPAAGVRLESALTLPRALEDAVDFAVDADDVYDLSRARSALDNAIGRAPAHHQLLGWPHLLQGSMNWTCEKESTFHRDGRPQYHPNAPLTVDENGCTASLTQADWDELDAQTRNSDWRLLLQLGTTNDWCWGDGGGLYFWIRHADLVAHRFDRVWTVMQCS